MKFVNSCPYAVRVVAPIEGRLCDFFVKSVRMRLSDGNERARYGRSVLNDEVERCPTPSGEGEVDCLADCGADVRGVEFESYMGKSKGRGVRADLGGMWSELSRRGFWATLAALDVPWLLWCLKRILSTPGRRRKAPPHGRAWASRIW